MIRRTFAVIAILAFVPFSSFADHHEGHKDMHKEMKEPSKEDRAKMADLHDKMAACLRSDKPMKDCKDEMHKSCESMGDSCPMHAGHGKKMMMKHKGKHKDKKAEEHSH